MGLQQLAPLTCLIKSSKRDGRGNGSDVCVCTCSIYLALWIQSVIFICQRLLHRRFGTLICLLSLSKLCFSPSELQKHIICISFCWFSLRRNRAALLVRIPAGSFPVLFMVVVFLQLPPKVHKHPSLVTLNIPRCACGSRGVSCDGLEFSVYTNFAESS